MLRSATMAKTFSTDEAAQQAGVHYVTLRRWLVKDKIKAKIKPSVCLELSHNFVYRWTKEDIDRLRAYVEENWGAGRTGRPPKERKK